MHRRKTTSAAVSPSPSATTSRQNSSSSLLSTPAAVAAAVSKPALNPSPSLPRSPSDTAIPTSASASSPSLLPASLHHWDTSNWDKVDHLIRVVLVPLSLISRVIYYFYRQVLPPSHYPLVHSRHFIYFSSIITAYLISFLPYSLVFLSLFILYKVFSLSRLLQFYDRRLIHHLLSSLDSRESLSSFISSALASLSSLSSISPVSQSSFSSFNWLNFPDIERVAWGNRIIQRLWPYLVGELNAKVTVLMNDEMWNEGVRVKYFDIGAVAPRIEGIKVYEGEKDREHVRDGENDVEREKDKDDGGERERRREGKKQNDGEGDVDEHYLLSSSAAASLIPLPLPSSSPRLSHSKSAMSPSPSPSSSSLSPSPSSSLLPPLSSSSPSPVRKSFSSYFHRSRSSDSNKGLRSPSESESNNNNTNSMDLGSNDDPTLPSFPSSPSSSPSSFPSSPSSSSSLLLDIQCNFISSSKLILELLLKSNLTTDAIISSFHISGVLRIKFSPLLPSSVSDNRSFLPFENVFIAFIFPPSIDFHLHLLHTDLSKFAGLSQYINKHATDKLLKKIPLLPKWRKITVGKGNEEERKGKENSTNSEGEGEGAEGEESSMNNNDKSSNNENSSSSFSSPNGIINNRKLSNQTSPPKPLTQNQKDGLPTSLLRLHLTELINIPLPPPSLSSSSSPSASNHNTNSNNPKIFLKITLTPSSPYDKFLSKYTQSDMFTTPFVEVKEEMFLRDNINNIIGDNVIQNIIPLSSLLHPFDMFIDDPSTQKVKIELFHYNKIWKNELMGMTTISLNKCDDNENKNNNNNDNEDEDKSTTEEMMMDFGIKDKDKDKDKEKDKNTKLRLKITLMKVKSLQNIQRFDAKQRDQKAKLLSDQKVQSDLAEKESMKNREKKSISQSIKGIFTRALNDNPYDDDDEIDAKGRNSHEDTDGITMNIPHVCPTLFPEGECSTDSDGKERNGGRIGTALIDTEKIRTDNNYFNMNISSSESDSSSMYSPSHPPPSLLPPSLLSFLQPVGVLLVKVFSCHNLPIGGLFTSDPSVHINTFSSIVSLKHYLSMVYPKSSTTLYTSSSSSLSSISPPLFPTPLHHYRLKSKKNTTNPHYHYSALIPIYNTQHEILHIQVIHNKDEMLQEEREREREGGSGIHESISGIINSDDSHQVILGDCAVQIRAVAKNPLKKTEKMFVSLRNLGGKGKGKKEKEKDKTDSHININHSDIDDDNTAVALSTSPSITIQLVYRCLGNPFCAKEEE